MRPAVQRALQSIASESHLRQIIFITDGAVGNEEGLFGLIEAGLGNARLFTVGIGSAPNSWFMRKAAEVGRGTFTIISSLHEVGEKMDRLFRKLEQPQVTNIAVRWPSGVIVDAYPPIVPDLYLGEPITVRAKVSGAFRPGDAVRIVGDSVSGAWASDVALNISEDSPGVAALWARARIANLLDLERRGASSEETRAAIIDTALKHHLVSKYTSLVAIDKTPVRESTDPLKSEQVANLIPYGQSGSAIFGFPATATRAPAMRNAGLALLISALLLLTAPALRRKARHGLAY
jgi:Ca-activated chloride channel family protein